MENVTPGKYKAKTASQIIVWEKPETGSVNADVMCEIVDGPFAGQVVPCNVNLIKTDGSLNDKSHATLKTVFGWDGADPFWLADNTPSEVMFEIVTENEDVQDSFTGETKTYSKVKYLNPPGGGFQFHAMGDRRSILAKHGAKFRALASAAKPVAQTSKPSAPAAPQPAKPVVTLDEAWGECVKVNGANAETVWLAELKRLNITDAPTAAQCAELKSIFADDVPFDFPPTPTAPPQLAATPQPKPSPATAAVLSESEIIQLETALTACPDPKRAVDYMKHRGWIPADGKLEKCDRPSFVNITTRTPAFVRMVDGWKG